MGGVAGFGSSLDCAVDATDPLDLYDPSGFVYCIPVVVHVLRSDDGTVGNIPISQVWHQINILNEDFNAIPATNGADGTDLSVRFTLAAVNYYNDSTALNDSGDYWTGRAVDPSRHLNIYTNTASGYLGYANIPQSPSLGPVGSVSDRVVIRWDAFGRDAPIGDPYDQGRTVTHEVGHYLGLYHTFQDGCDDGGCLVSSDLICDTPDESVAHFGCAQTETCGTPDPIHNYMNYTDDLCMMEFTPQQARRVRCSIFHWRPLLWTANDCTPVCGDSAAGSPFLAHDTPASFAAECCAQVCAADAYCCAVQWDQTCVNEAFAICTDCGDPEAGGAYESNGSPACADGDCCEAVCAVDSYCCLIDWDGLCVSQALEICAGCGDVEAGSPYEANGTPGCDDLTCCAAVCAADSWCCEVQWDAVCRDQALVLCAGCGDADAGSCFTAHATEQPSCDDSDCCVSVCGADPYCCTVNWDAICRNQAFVSCAGCGDAAAGSCFVSHEPGSTGCDDAGCCASVCEVDPYCCSSTWDSICTGEAAVSCDGWCAGDLDFDGDVDGADIGSFLASWNGTGGLPDLDGSGLVDGADFGILLSSWGACGY